jgi:tetratricopeptide (TPR) repeat protein
MTRITRTTTRCTALLLAVWTLAAAAQDRPDAPAPAASDTVRATPPRTPPVTPPRTPPRTLPVTPPPTPHVRTHEVPRRNLPRPPAHSRHNGRHSMEVRIEEVRGDSLFAPVVEQLRALDLDAARRTLESIRDGQNDVIVRQVAAYDRIEIDFFDGDFTTAREAYQTFAATHKRGYLTNDAIARLFLIDENSDQMQMPLRSFARSELYERVGEIDSALAVCRVALDRFAGSALIDDMQLKTGDLLLETETPAAALPHYRAVADSMPDTPLAARALMRIGHYQAEFEHDVPAAIEVYESVLERFPDSLEAPEARKILEGLHRRT